MTLNCHSVQNRSIIITTQAIRHPHGFIAFFAIKTDLLHTGIHLRFKKVLFCLKRKGKRTFYKLLPNVDHSIGKVSRLYYPGDGQPTDYPDIHLSFRRKAYTPRRVKPFRNLWFLPATSLHLLRIICLLHRRVPSTLSCRPCGCQTENVCSPCFYCKVYSRISGIAMANFVHFMISLKFYNRKHLFGTIFCTCRTKKQPNRPLIKYLIAQKQSDNIQILRCCHSSDVCIIASTTIFYYLPAKK